MTIYLATGDSVSVYRDESLRARLDAPDVECVAAGGGRAFVGTFAGDVYRTADAGETWETVGDGIDGAVTSVAVSPHDADEVWVGTEPSTVYRSTDAGETWTERPGLTDLPSAGGWSFPPRPDTHHVRWLEPDPTERDRWYVGIEAGALVLTDDAGANWHDRPSGSRRDNHQLAAHPDAPGRVYSAAGDGYAESRTAGESWEHPEAGLDHRYCWSVTSPPDDPNTVLVSAASGPRRAHTADSAESYLYRRRGAAGAWQRIADEWTGAGVTRAVLARGADAGEVYAATNRGLYRTRDAGDSWTALDVDWPAHFTEHATDGLAVAADE